MKKISDKQKIKNQEKTVTTRELHAFFRLLWDEREDEEGNCYCYETNQTLPGYKFRGNTCCYHHILPKSKYPEFAFVRKNIVILHPEVHTQVESNIDKCPKVSELTRKIKTELIW